MEHMTFTETITAPKEKVWHVMLDDATYRDWTSVFNPGSYYEGGWNQGDSIRFLGNEDDGTVSGMYSTIEESRPYEYVAIRHLGEIHHGVEKPFEAPGLEAYGFEEVDGVTTVTVTLEVPTEYKEMFMDMWPKGLARIKELATAS